MSTRPRVMIASPHAAERAAFADWLGAEQFEPVPLASTASLVDEIRQRAFDLIVVDAAMALDAASPVIGAVRARNPRTPIIAIGDPSTARESQAQARGATYLERPVEQTWFGCTVSLALMDTRPERRSVRKAVDRYEAVVEGVRAHIVDVSKEGLRLEVPRGRRSAPPPPYFNVSVPILGVSLCVKRMWTCSVPQEPDAAWFGAELSGNQSRIQRAWLEFVQAVPTR